MYILWVPQSSSVPGTTKLPPSFTVGVRKYRIFVRFGPKNEKELVFSTSSVLRLRLFCNRLTGKTLRETVPADYCPLGKVFSSRKLL